MSDATDAKPHAAKPIRKIVSGGQTGVDRAALDVALELGVACGGWCPKGRRAEDGTIAERYPLTETSTRAYPERTRRNVLDSDGTLILARGRPTGGTALTIKIAAETGKPCFIVDLSAEADWKVLGGSVSVANSVASLTDLTVDGQAHRFYRIIEY